MRAVRFFLILAFAALMFYPANALLYDLCDSASIDSSTKTLLCRITKPKYYFTQQSVDNFWKSVLADQNYLNGRIENVHWLIAGTVVNVIEDTAFVKDSNINVAWDITLRNDVNMVFGETVWDTNKDFVSEATHTAIKATRGGQKPLLFFSPREGKKTIRNLVLEQPSGYATYITANLIKPMEINIEGDLMLSSSFIENAAIVKAGSIVLDDGAKLKNIGKIEAGNLSLNKRSVIYSVGSLGQKAIELKNDLNGLQLSVDSRIIDLLGSISVSGSINLSGDSRIKTVQPDVRSVIESIEAKSLTLSDKSEINGVGGTPGSIVLQATLSLDTNSLINGREKNQIKKIETGSISLTNSSRIQEIVGPVIITSNQQFKLGSGARIVSLDGNIESCASLSLDGNETRIIFAGDSKKQIRAPAIDLNNGAQIVCLGKTDCNYNHLKQECATKPNAQLAITSLGQGAAPLTVQFNGSCTAPTGLASCKINYGDGNEQEFIGSALHTYFEAGNYIATLSATDSSNLTAIATKIISVAAGSGNQLDNNTQGTATVEITILPPAVEQGGEVYVEIDLDSEAETFSLQNDAGLPVMTSVPSAFPAKAGPFKTFPASKPGTYNFTLSGTTKNGRIFSAQAAFEILKKEGAFSFDAFLPLLIVFAIVLVVIVLLARKLIKEGKIGAKKTILPPGEKPKEGEKRWAWKGPTEEKQKPGEKPPAAPPTATTPEKPMPPTPTPPQAPAGPEELPPWLREEEEEEENGSI